MSSKTFLITYLQLSAVMFGLEHFPVDTPKRWEAIALYLEHVNRATTDVDGLDTLCIDITNTPGPASKKTKVIFTGSASDCKEVSNAIVMDTTYKKLFESLKQLYAPMFSTSDRNSPLKPLILTPPIRTCCGYQLNIRNRPSFPIVYTTTGTYIAASYHGNCRKCNTVYYPGHVVGSSQQYDISSLKYLQISSQTAFEVTYLQHVTHQLSICSSTFESIAELYTMNNLTTDRQRLSHLLAFSRSSIVLPWKLNPQRLEEGWYLYRLANFFQTRNMSTGDMFASVLNGRKDIESLCKEAYLVTCKEPPKWIHHVCEVPGCRERFATLDGNEKVTRTMCAAPKSKVKLPSTGLSIMRVCPDTPALGGNHVRGCKFCVNHRGEDDNDTNMLTDLSHDPDNLKLNHLITTAVNNGCDLEEAESGDGCRKECNVTKYYNRTAGIVALVRPCGVVVNIAEMYTSESMTQMYLFLLQTFGRGDDVKQQRFLGYDRACGLHPFLCNLEKKGIDLATYLLTNVKFMVDRFHVKGHTESCCMPPTNPNCKYHPDLDTFKDVVGVNTECAEQAFRWLNKLKYSLREMSRYKFNFFLLEMVQLHNSVRELHLKAEGKMRHNISVRI